MAVESLCRNGGAACPVARQIPAAMTFVCEWFDFEMVSRSRSHSSPRDRSMLHETAHGAVWSNAILELRYGRNHESLA